MIDIHNHVIYKFDDGPSSIEESVAMLKAAEGQGISDVFATSHFAEVISPAIESDYMQKLAKIRERLDESGMKIRVHSGSEMFYHHYMEQTVSKSRIGTLGEKGRYILMEFPMYLMPNGAEQTLFELSTSNYIPIVAHPERYNSVIEKPEKCLDFIRYGALLQVNVGSVLGHFGSRIRRTVIWMLEQRLVHFMASDAHGVKGRRFELADAAIELEAFLDRDYIEDLVQRNPQKIVDDEKLHPVEIAEEALQKSFLQRIGERFKGS